jgi:single-stranded-DNA-specific exonuclease
MNKRWRIHPHDSGRIELLEKQAGVSPIVAQLLLCRGISDAGAARQFLQPKMTELRDPEDLPGLSEAADRVFAAAKAGRRLVIYGDYDADGMTGTAVLYRCLQLLGADVGYYVPNRLDEGYGLNDEALRKLAERGASLVISVDCGIASVREAQTARDAGLELIITDHHQFADELPDAAGIVHPRLPGTSYPFSGLCGAGVAFKLAWGLCCRASQSKRVNDRLRNFLLTAVGIAAIGTVADVVPLLDENRVLVKYGLNSLRERPTAGLQSLLRVTKLNEKPSLTAEDIAFSLAPRLNAAGRLGQAQLGVELLTTDSTERANALADYIHELNSSRDSLERSVYLSANKQIKEQFDPTDPAFVLAGRGWHAGVIGIVAGRLAEKYHRPVVLLSIDEFASKPVTGSARSACGLNLHASFSHCSEHLIAHGGHAAAAGLKIEESRIDAFRLSFCELADGEIASEDRVAEVRIDAEALLSQLTLRTIQQLEQVAPFGQGNPRPVLCATGVEIADPPRHLGGGERHLAMKVRQHHVALRAIGFGHGEWLNELTEANGPIDIAFRPVINEFRGRRSVEIQLVDWRLSRQPALTAAHG